jgi:hypothetical protein
MEKWASGRNNGIDAVPSMHGVFEPGKPTWPWSVGSLSLGVLLAVAVLSGVVACEQPGDGGTLCDPGDVQVCPCPGAGNGVQSCNSGGTAWNACEGCTTGQCVPECSGKECGSDGCGGSCGKCFGDDVCDTGQCVSGSSCNATCGSSGCECGQVCGKSCGSCPQGYSCVDGCHCDCFSQCAGKECGGDGCGGSCGSCSGGKTCQSDRCVSESTGGTWTDSLSGLTWQNPDSGNELRWTTAKEYCADLAQGGHTNWRMPDIRELRSLIRGCPATESDGSCNIDLGDCLSYSCVDWPSCNGCSSDQGPAGGCYWDPNIQGSCGLFWSSTTGEDSAQGAFLVHFGDAYVADGNTVWDDARVRCVRE